MDHEKLLTDMFAQMQAKVDSMEKKLEDRDAQIA
jgi:hypothetical protein